MKLKNFVVGIACAAFVNIGVFPNPQQVSASTWHNRTPKVIRGTWYHHIKDKATNTYVTYWQNCIGGNYLGYSDRYQPFYKLPAHGLSDIRYCYRGHHSYQFRGTDMFNKKETYQAKIFKGILYVGHEKLDRNRPGKLISELKAQQALVLKLN